MGSSSTSVSTENASESNKSAKKQKQSSKTVINITTDAAQTIGTAIAKAIETYLEQHHPES